MCVKTDMEVEKSTESTFKAKSCRAGSCGIKSGLGRLHKKTLTQGHRFIKTHLQ